MSGLKIPFYIVPGRGARLKYPPPGGLWRDNKIRLINRKPDLPIDPLTFRLLFENYILRRGSITSHTQIKNTLAC